MVSDDTLLAYWRDEQTFPAWFRQSTGVWHQTEVEFLEFCHKCWDIVEIQGKALLYIEKKDEAAEIHLSMKRGQDIEISELESIRMRIFQNFPIIIGWVNKRNKGLKAICKVLGLDFYGVTMIRGESHGKVIEWEAYTAFRQNF